MSTCIYTLRLRDGCVYVGKTKNPGARAADHADPARAARWVTLHGGPAAPLHVVRTGLDDTAANGEEDRVTLQLMLLLGVNAVRGGQYALHVDDYTARDVDHLAAAAAHHLNLSIGAVMAQLF